MRIVALSADDADEIRAVINAAAERYSGVIPAESDTAPYMSAPELAAEMAKIQFYGAVRDQLVGVVGIQERPEVTLVRHLYVRPSAQREGIGSALLETALERAESQTVLVGTWKAAEWAIEFYRDHGFEYLGTDRDLLSEHWDVPDHQQVHSVVLRTVDRS